MTGDEWWRPLPQGALAAMDRCNGNLYNRFDEGGYLIWFAPDRKVFIDSRYFPYPDDLLQEHMRIERTGDAAGAFRRYDIRCAYLPAESLVARRLVDDGWNSLYRDSEWTVLAETGTAAAPAIDHARGTRVEP